MANMESTPTPTNFSEWLEGPELIALAGGDEAGREYRLGTREYDWHSHARAQLFCVSDGLIHVQTPRGSWLLPPHRAGYMPPDTPHRVRVSGALSGWSVFLLPSCSGPQPPQPCVLAITPLLHELGASLPSSSTKSGWRRARRCTCPCRPIPGCSGSPVRCWPIRRQAVRRKNGPRWGRCPAATCAG
ncbi:hypothetical protein ABD440_01940 [Chromobacterium piscinae]|uniref:AraC family ligand binding domain-containing protein n=1 Tax=Chromobacterium piscinae TaxID=686831 RepID=UPI0031FC52F5